MYKQNNTRMVQTCEKDANEEMTKDYARVGTKRDKNAMKTSLQMEVKYRSHNEGKGSRTGKPRGQNFMDDKNDKPKEEELKKIIELLIKNYKNCCHKYKYQN